MGKVYFSHFYLWMSLPWQWVSALPCCLPGSPQRARVGHAAVVPGSFPDGTACGQNFHERLAGQFVCHPLVILVKSHAQSDVPS